MLFKFACYLRGIPTGSILMSAIFIFITCHCNSYHISHVKYDYLIGHIQEEKLCKSAFETDAKTSITKNRDAVDSY